MPTVYFMCGLPATGKSTYIKENLRGFPIVSTDNYIEKYAALVGRTYDQCFRDAIDNATVNEHSKVRYFVEDGISFVWDQTNLSPAKRKFLVSMIPKDWNKVVICLPTPDEDEWNRRLNNRPGKTIPKNVLESMKNTFSFPTDLEGFDEIIHVKEPTVA